MAAALEGFRLELAAGRSLDWLTTAVRRAFAIVDARIPGMPDRVQGAAMTRDNLLDLARVVEDCADRLNALGMPEDEAVKQLVGEAGWRIILKNIGYSRATAEFLFAAAGSLQPDLHKWRASNAKELRIRRARYISPIFRAAFSWEPHVNDYEGAADLGPWPDFFDRTIRLATGERAPNLRETVKEARTRDLPEGPRGLEKPIRYPTYIIDLA
jgi:hypothetical protein